MNPDFFGHFSASDLDGFLEKDHKRQIKASVLKTLSEILDGEKTDFLQQKEKGR